MRGPLSFLTLPLVQRKGTPTYEGARSSRRAHSASEDEQGSTDARGGCAPARGPFGYTSLRNSGVVIHPLQTKRGEAKHRKKSPARNGHEMAPRAAYAPIRTPRVSRLASSLYSVCNRGSRPCLRGREPVLRRCLISTHTKDYGVAGGAPALRSGRRSRVETQSARRNFAPRTPKLAHNPRLHLRVEDIPRLRKYLRSKNSDRVTHTGSRTGASPRPDCGR